MAQCLGLFSSKHKKPLAKDKYNFAKNLYLNYNDDIHRGKYSTIFIYVGTSQLKRKLGQLSIVNLISDFYVVNFDQHIGTLHAVH